MRVSLQLPTGVSLDYNVKDECTFLELQNIIQDTEGIPPDMQQFAKLRNKPTEMHQQPLTEIFPESIVDGELRLNLFYGPLQGGLADCDLCLCGCQIFSHGKCTAHVSNNFVVAD
jgi:hypothetical protein